MLVFRPSISNQINPWKNKKRVGDFYCHNYYTVWQSRKVAWEHVFFSFGIRRSDKIQYWPIWNMSNNCERAYLFGFWKFYFEIGYKW